MGIALSRTYIRRAFQMSANLSVGKSKESTIWFNSNTIYKWARAKFADMQLPDNVRTLSKYRAGQRLEIIYEDGKYFCMLAEHPDENYAARTWTTEAEINIQDDGTILFGVRLSYATSTVNNDAPIIYSVPGFVKKIADRNGVIDVYPVLKESRAIESQDDVLDLCEFIESDKRKLPIVVISEREARADRPDYESGYLIDTGRLSKELWLHAHVYYLPFGFQELFKKYIGERWAVYDGALRTYYAGIDFEEDPYYKHPIALPYTILSAYMVDSDGNALTGGDAYCSICVDKIKEQIMDTRLDWGEYGHSFFYTAKRRLLESQIQSGNTEEITAAYEEQIQQLEQQVVEAENEAYSAMENYYGLEKQLSEALNTIRQQNYRIDGLIDQIKATSDSEEMTIPETYSELPEWLEEYFPGRIKLHNRAKSGLKEAAFEDVGLVYKTLQLLGEDYYRMRTSDTVSRNDIKEKCDNLRIEMAPAISDSSAGEYGDEYYVSYKGRRTKIDQHIKYGNAHDPRKTMRIYYFWDDEENAVVLCWLTSHLTTRQS